MPIETIPGFLRKILCATCGLALAAAAAGAGASDAAETPSLQQMSRPTAPAADAPHAHSGAGLIAVLPAAGAPPDANLRLADPDLATAFSTSSEGLFEEVLPDGSVRVSLQGRFQSVLFATVAPGGGVRTSHLPLPAPGLALHAGPEPRSCRPTEAGQEANRAQN